MSYFVPRCGTPRLVAPVRVGAADGPTRGAAASGRWRRSTHGYYVPTEVDGSVVEQRILEQSMRLAGAGAVTGWAALRMNGAAYFDGDGHGHALPVPLVSSRQLEPGRDARISRRRVDPDDIQLVRGIPCLRPELALIEELARLDDERDRVLAVDMALAADVVSLASIRDRLDDQPPRLRIPLCRVLDLADAHSRSPAETRIRLMWMLDLGFPRPLCNAAVLDLDGRFLGMPDLLDPTAGVVGEYDGSAHRERERHRRDVDRLDAFRRVGIECFTIVAGDSAATALRRMREARERALATTGPRAWTWRHPA